MMELFLTLSLITSDAKSTNKVCCFEPSTNLYFTSIDMCPWDAVQVHMADCIARGIR